MLNRRAFLKRFGLGVAAACALASLPEAAIRGLSLADAGKRCACEYMRKLFNEYSQGGLYRIPVAMRVSPGLYEAYRGELLMNERFTASDARDGYDGGLMFKGVTVVENPDLANWDVEFTRDREQGRAWVMTRGAGRSLVSA